MSLNGLDDTEVLEAYQSALSEAGGWFLLKYASRDAVKLLTRGTGGLVECRSAVSEENSPLFGFLLYRRRKILIKYIPESTSRLVQARVAVHFQAVTEKFTPHDMVFPISLSDDLNDATLNAACLLHTAGLPRANASPNNSPRRRKLDGITEEDAEEVEEEPVEQPVFPKRQIGSSLAHQELKPIVENEEKTDPSKENRPSPVTVLSTPIPTSSTSLPTKEPTPAQPPTTSSGTADPVTNEALQARLDSLTQFSKDYKHLLDPNSEEAQRRASSQTLRPSTSELIAYGYKPKVKLGPRPKAAPDNTDKRPHTSGSGTWNPSRPVVGLPPGMRAKPRRGNSTSRPKTRDSSGPPPTSLPPPPPIPDLPDYSTMIIPPRSSGSGAASVKSLPVNYHKAPAMTPEKQRLMKALELRKKQMQAKAAAANKKIEEEEEEKRRKQKEQEEEEQRQREEQRALAESEHLARLRKEQEQTIPEEPDAEEPRPEELNHLNHEQVSRLEDSACNASDIESNTTSAASADPSKADSGVDVNEDASEHANDHENKLEIEDETSTGMTSSPTSLQESTDQSTRPSSISEDDLAPKELEDVPEEAAEEVVPMSFLRDESDDTDVTEDKEQGSEYKSDIAEEQSGESSPTVVPEDRSPVPSEPVQSQPNPKRNEGKREEEEEVAHGPLTDTDGDRDTPSSPLSQNASLQGSRPPSITTKKKRRAQIQPITVTTQLDESDAEFLSDDSFMEELQSATLQEAKPICVSKSPITPFFPRPGSSGPFPVLSRSVSTPIDYARRDCQTSHGLISPNLLLSPNLLVNSQAIVAKKVNVSSGISQRIKALTEKSKREASSPATDSLSNGLGPDLVTRKSNLASSNPNSPPFADPQKEHKKRYITTHIVRDDQVRSPDESSPTEELYRHIGHSPQLSLGRSSTDTTNMTGSYTNGRPMSPTFSVQSLVNENMEEEKEEKEEGKRRSRTSRIFKRVSASFTSGSKINLPKDKDHDLPFSGPVLANAVTTGVQVGDLNVQFPDTLLWKRRWVEIDHKGNLVLTLSKANEHTRGVTKRYHMNEFRMPYAPDQDQQELPYSILLDFLDGRTMQCACEDSFSQMSVLQLLKDAHAAARR